MWELVDGPKKSAYRSLNRNAWMAETGKSLQQQNQLFQKGVDNHTHTSAK